MLSPENEDKLKYGICVPWGRLISHKLIKENNIQFDETRFANDTMFAIKAAYASKVITADPRVVYCFTANKGSLTHTLNKDSIRCRYGVDVRKNSFLKEPAPSFRQMIFWQTLFLTSKPLFCPPILLFLILQVMFPLPPSSLLPDLLIQKTPHSRSVPVRSTPRLPLKKNAPDLH